MPHAADANSCAEKVSVIISNPISPNSSRLSSSSSTSQKSNRRCLRLIGHRLAPASVADDESHQHDRDRCRNVQRLGRGVTCGRHGQRDHDLDRDSCRCCAACESRDSPRARPKSAPPTTSVAKRSAVAAEVDLGVSRRQRQQREKDDDAGPIVEQALAGDPRLQALRHADPPDHRQHRDRIGRRDEGAEQQAVKHRHGDSEPGRHEEEAEPHDDGRNHDTYGREREDQPLFPGDVVGADVQAAREQQQAENAMQQQRREIDAGDRRCATPSPIAGCMRPTNTATIDTRTPIAVMPTASGSLTKRWLM